MDQERLAQGCCRVAENFAPEQRIELQIESLIEKLIFFTSIYRVI